jgi:hypothetical protein
VGPKSLDGYADFLQPRLSPGTRIVAIAGDRKGSRGVLSKFQRGRSEILFYDIWSYDSPLPECQVRWDSEESWVWLDDVALEVGTSIYFNRAYCMVSYRLRLSAV